MIIDCSVGFGAWPFARFAEDTPASLDRLLDGAGIGRALVSSAEAILYEEPEECNRALERKLARYPRLVPVPVASPRVKSASGIVAKPDIKAVKLIPSYHCYSLGEERALALCAKIAERRIPVLVQMRVEDERSHYELLKVPGVPVEDIVGLAGKLPGLTIVALCPYYAEAGRLAALPNVYVDIAFVENLDTLGRLCAKVPAAKVLFGSHAPWLYPQAAAAKLALGSIGKAERTAIGSGNAARLFRVKG
jgi:predicted TIM-barrel fold metal-dependent hydrolase